MLRWLLNGTIGALAVCYVTGFGAELWRASNAPHAPINHSTPAAKERGSDTKAQEESAEEAIARYNKWLMIFTGILAAATVGLGLATIGLYFAGERQLALAKDTSNRQAVEIQNQIDITREANRAAQKSADAAVATERARFYIVIKRHNLDRVLETLGRFPNSQTMPLSFEPVIEYAFKNYGKTPGIVSEVITD
jgi:hypothetical protein